MRYNVKFQPLLEGIVDESLKTASERRCFRIWLLLLNRQKYQRNVNQGKERWILVVTGVNAILNLVKNFLDNSGSIENPSNQVTAKLWIIPSPGIKKILAAAK